MGDHLLVDRHTCAALVITCSDFRFKTAERAFLESVGLRDDYDLIARPGASRALAEAAGQASGLMDEVQLLHGLHGFLRVLLIHHMRCGAYADLAATRDEREVHAEHLRTAADAVERAIPHITAETYLADLAGDAPAVTPIARANNQP